MAEGTCRDEWQRTSSLMAFIGNTFKAKGSKAYLPSDLDPFAKKNRQSDATKIDQKAGFAALKLLFPPKG